MRKALTGDDAGISRMFPKRGSRVAAIIATTLLAGCSIGQNEGTEEEGTDSGSGQEAADVPEGFQEIDAGVISYAVPEDWVEAPEAEEGEDLEYRYELLDDDDYILSFAGLVPIGDEADDVDDLSARDVALDIASNYTVGYHELERETDQEIEVSGARDSARNDHVLEDRERDYIENKNLTDVIVVSEDDEVAVFRMNIGDDSANEAEQEQIIDSIRVD